MTTAVRRKRGRKSAAELAMPAALIEVPPRPDPSDGESLTDEETALWWAVINQLPAEHAPPDAHALLAAYCRHIVSARRLSDSIRTIEAALATEVAEGRSSAVEAAHDSARALGKLLRLRDGEVRAASSLATRLRLTAQAASRPNAAPGPVRVGPVPWEGRQP
jgi:hypothetical protein